VGLSVLASQTVNDNVVEPIESCRPSTSVPYATSGANLFEPAAGGSVDTRGIGQDLTGDDRPAAGMGGWTPSALQAK
jgi:hypothetical protein